jgi:hypothetical protein
MVNISEKNTKIAGNETKKTLFKKTKINLHFGRDLVQNTRFAADEAHNFASERNPVTPDRRQ